MKMRGIANVQEGRSLTDEFWSERGFGVQVCIEIFRKDVDEVHDFFVHGFSDVAVLDERVLRVLGEEWGSGHTDGWGAVGPDFSEGLLRESDPVHEVSVVLDVLNTEGVGVELAVGRSQGDLGGLGLGDRVERRRSLSDTERNGKMTPAGLGVDGEGCVAPSVEDGTVSGMEGGAKVWGTFQVGEDADELDEVALRGVGIVGGSHDDGELDLGADHEEVDETADDLHVLLLVDRGLVGRLFEEIHGVGGPLGGERVRAAGCEDLEDGVEQDAVRAPVAGSK